MQQVPFKQFRISVKCPTAVQSIALTNGRKASTSRLYLNQINAIYNYAVKENLVPKIKLLKGVKTTIPAKQDRELLTDTELRRMRYADLSDSRPMSFARDMFFFSIYGRGISFTDLANIKKTDIQGFLLTYTSQAISQPRITVQWDSAMQEIADRYPSKFFEYLPLHHLRQQSQSQSRRKARPRKRCQRLQANCRSLQLVGSSLHVYGQGHLSATD